MSRDRRAEHAAEAARRAHGEGFTPEDRILFSLLEGGEAALACARRLAAETALLDQDYLAYWVDELGVQERWRITR